MIMGRCRGAAVDTFALDGGIEDGVVADVGSSVLLYRLRGRHISKASLPYGRTVLWGESLSLVARADRGTVLK
jgi:hypothetical protein